MNNQPTFATLSDAHAAGYLSPRATGPFTYSQDVSGGRSSGYRYILRARREDGTVDFDTELGRTVTVWLAEELNGIRQPGCFAAMYPPAVREKIRTATAPLHDARGIVAQARRERRDRKAVLAGR